MTVRQPEALRCTVSGWSVVVAAGTIRNQDITGG